MMGVFGSMKNFNSTLGKVSIDVDDEIGHARRRQQRSRREREDGLAGWVSGLLASMGF